ncbi:uncharacterized protein N0V89_011302 [Didymosphaeria variabile]|uniref:Uncharacterized protein n=1 Tax=Didymosphaeria variabile TaxID=1932322 RepID=A0A9W9C6Y9_9PLEO|nr:uncharacterized protein N0V89_011302 [Didymosphaeria variabile]KAJ4347361.1 hypothetical protein N0V89_011302 [Didymosphaeria variabile]
MAHQAHHLPWQSLSSAFRFASKTERAKYQPTYDPPLLDDIIITPAIEKKIATSLNECRSNNPFQLQHECAQRVWRGLKVDCTCPLLDVEKRASFFVENWRSCRQTCSSTKEHHHDSIELLKMLILHNEMEPLFKLCASPDFDLSQNWWSFPYDIPQDYGWAEVMRSALMMYICLNVFYLKPETYGPELREENNTGVAVADYRDTTSYQRALFRCTAGTKLDTYTYPHREFFGVPEGMYVADWHWSNDELLGLTSLERRQEPGYGHVPTKEDVARARRLVCKAGRMPAELGLQILECAGYVPARRIPVADDPLHKDNADELRNYLDYCWQLVIRCDMVMKSCGKSIDWYGEIVVCIKDLWGDPDTTEWIEDGQDEWDEDFRDWPLNAAERHWYRFVGY